MVLACRSVPVPVPRPGRGREVLAHSARPARFVDRQTSVVRARLTVYRAPSPCLHISPGTFFAVPRVAWSARQCTAGRGTAGRGAAGRGTAARGTGVCTGLPSAGASCSVFICLAISVCARATDGGGALRGRGRKRKPKITKQKNSKKRKRETRKCEKSRVCACVCVVLALRARGGGLSEHRDQGRLVRSNPLVKPIYAAAPCAPAIGRDATWKACEALRRAAPSWRRHFFGR